MNSNVIDNSCKPFTKNEIYGCNLFKEIMFKLNGEDFFKKINLYSPGPPAPAYEINEYNNSSLRANRIKWMGLLNEIFSNFDKDVKNEFINAHSYLQNEKREKKKIEFLMMNTSITKNQFKTYCVLDNQVDKLDYLYEILDRSSYDNFVKV